MILNLKDSYVEYKLLKYLGSIDNLLDTKYDRGSIGKIIFWVN